MERTQTQHAPVEIYSPTARRFHWWTVLLVVIQVPLGLYMAYRGNVLDLWNDTTNNLYSTHKLIGIIIFFMVLARLLYRLTHGAPADEPTITWWQRIASHLNHWSLYVLLLVIPIVGYVGISQYPALSIFGMSLPGVVAENSDAASTTFLVHFWLAMLLVLMAAVHFLAAMFHYFVRQDGVLSRMLPSLRRD
ncbi:MAG TPA: cytochrome b [Hyphomicrobiaceae bacterium]|nr:cytochrome b [Hyphomicrobiaceae bacterium]